MKARRTRGSASPPATLRCQRKNKRHVKHCAEWAERQEVREAMERPLGFFKVVRRAERDSTL